MDSECELMPPKAFDLFESVVNYNPKESPSNGYEYLYQVINEASNTPQTKVADICTDRFKKNQTIFVEETETSEAPPEYIPSQEWQKLQLKYFENIREEIKWKRIVWNKKDPEYQAKFLPNEFDEESWFKFCYESLPLLRTILSLNQPGLDTLLDYYVQWLEEKKIDFCQRTNMWLFSILVGLEEPLDPDICSNLRCIIRLSKNKRLTLKDSNDDLLPPLNLLICIASKFFKQNDLGD